MKEILDIVKTMKEFVEREDSRGIGDCRNMNTDTLLESMNRIENAVLRIKHER